MFKVQVAFANSGWKFMFKNSKEPLRIKQMFEQRFSNPDAQNIVVEDDFGNWATVSMMLVQGILIEDLDKMPDMEIEEQLIKIKAQRKFKAKAERLGGQLDQIYNATAGNG